MKISGFMQSHPLRAYFVLAYGITWGGILALLIAKGFRLDVFQMSDLMLIFLGMILGPSASSLLLTGMRHGTGGLRALWTDMTRWRAEIRWWLIALLTTPMVMLAILSLLHVVVAPGFAPGWRVMGVLIGLIAGFCEEIGWTGFATPLLLQRYRPFVAGLMLGVVWALWHMLADLVGNVQAFGTAGWIQWFVIYWLLVLIPYRILMTWIYSKTRSLLIAQLMHASHTGWLFILTPAAADLGLLWQTVFAASLWVLVAMVAIVERQQVMPVRPKPFSMDG